MKQTIVSTLVVTILILFVSCPSPVGGTSSDAADASPAATYSVTYLDNGATDGSAPGEQTKTEGVELILAGNTGALVRAGNTFVGWNTAADGSGTDYSEGSTYTADAALILYARWTSLPTYSVTYVANGATSGTPPATQTKIEDVDLTLATNSGHLARTGYSFVGWSTAPASGGTSYAVGDTYSANAALALYASWTVATYSVTYDANHATSGTPPATQIKTYNVSLTLATNLGSLARTGYTFQGWNTAADGSGTTYAVGATYTANGHLALYAKWKPLTYSVIYNANGATGGTPPATQIKTYGVSLTLAVNSGILVREGRIFQAWNTASDGSGTTYTVGSTYTANTGVTLYAKWLDTGANYISPNIGILPYVPLGSFQRDAIATNISVIAQRYRIGQYEITRAQFAAVMGTDPSSTTYSTGTSDPVQMVRWYGAIAFCNKLSIAEGLTPVYSVTGVNFNTLTYSNIPVSSNADWDAATADWSANGYRLPTEMEWMWAAMGATGGTTGYLKAFAGSTGSNAIGDYAWYMVNSSATTHPTATGIKLANELGLYDMSGNVYEWCWDRVDAATLPAYAFSGTIQSDTEQGRGAASGTDHIIRGGCFDSHEVTCGLGWREAYYPDSPNYIIGLRVVRP